MRREDCRPFRRGFLGGARSSISSRALRPAISRALPPDPAVSHSGRTFLTYDSHMANAFQLIGLDIRWRSSALAGAMKEVANAKDRTPKLGS